MDKIQVSYSDDEVNQEFTTINMLIKEFPYSGNWEKDVHELMEDIICNSDMEVVLSVKEMLPSIIGGIIAVGIYNNKNYEFSIAALAFAHACNFTKDGVVPDVVIKKFELELK